MSTAVAELAAGKEQAVTIRPRRRRRSPRRGARADGRGAALSGRGRDGRPRRPRRPRRRPRAARPGPQRRHEAGASLRISSLIEPLAAVAAHRPACADVTVSEMTAGDDGSVTHDQRTAARSTPAAQVLERRALAGRSGAATVVPRSAAAPIAPPVHPTGASRPEAGSCAATGGLIRTGYLTSRRFGAPQTIYAADEKRG